MSRRLLLALALAAVPAPVLADQASANACAASLAAEARMIYERALPGVAAGGDLKAVVKEAAISLVKGGQLSRGSARSAAEAAGACLVRL